MLKQSKDYWKKKAETEFLYAKAEEANWNKLQETQNQWKKRLDESSWLLKGAVDARKELEQVHTIEDKSYDHAVGERAKKMKLFGLQGLDVNELDRFRKQNKRAASKEKGRGSKEKEVTFSDTVDGNYHGPLKSASREKTEEEKYREEKARKLLQSDERRQREAKLKESMERIRVLEQCKELLDRPRIPKHHQPIERMADYTPDTLPTLTDEERAQNLRPGDREIMQIKPVIEQLRPWEDVMQEENNSRLFHIPGRYHHYMGAERLYPLNKFPATIEALLPVGHQADDIPENVLLKDKNNLLANRPPPPDEETKKLMHQQKTSRLKRAVFDLSRSPIKHYPIIPSADPYLGEHSSHVHQGRTRPPLYHDKKDEEEEKKISQQFQWREHDFPDDNSVHRRAHPPVIFFENEAEKYAAKRLQEQKERELKEKEHDSLLDFPQQKYHLISSTSSTAASSLAGGSLMKSNTIAGGQSQMMMVPAGSLQAPSMTSTYPKSNMMSTSYYSSAGGEIDSQNDSANAVRSNYMATDSMRTEGSLPIKLIRLRKVKELTNSHLKNDLHFISLKQKEADEKKKAADKLLQYTLDPTNPLLK